MLQHREKKLRDIKGKQNYNILPHCEVGDKKIYKNLLRSMWTR